MEEKTCQLLRQLKAEEPKDIVAFLVREKLQVSYDFGVALGQCNGIGQKLKMKRQSKKRQTAADHLRQEADPSNAANAVVIKDEDLFFLSDATGDVPLDNDRGFGFYYHDCRFLQGYQLRISGRRPNVLAATSEHGFMSEFILSDPDLKQANGAKIAKQSVGIRWRRIVQATCLTFARLS